MYYVVARIIQEKAILEPFPKKIKGRPIGNVRREPNLFAKWQQRRGLPLSILHNMLNLLSYSNFCDRLYDKLTRSRKKYATA